MSESTMQATPDGRDFLLKEFETLREEIKETKARIFKLITTALIGIPAAYSVAKSYYTLPALSIVLPLLVCITGMVFISETRTLMKCGKYIRDNIEPALCPPSRQGGWEWWESTVTGGRIGDKLVALAFYGVFFVYYIVAVFLGAGAADHAGGNWIILYGSFYFVLGATYFVLGATFLAFLTYNFRYCTGTDWKWDLKSNGTETYAKPNIGADSQKTLHETVLKSIDRRFVY